MMSNLNFEQLYQQIVILSNKQELNLRGRTACIQYKKTGSCTRGKSCNFSHSPRFSYEYSSNVDTITLNRYFSHIIHLSNNPQFISKSGGKKMVIDEALTAVFLEASIQLNLYMQKKQMEIDDYGDVYDFFVGTVWLFCIRLEAICNSLKQNSKEFGIYKAIFNDCFSTSYKVWLDFEEETRLKCTSLQYKVNDTTSECNQSLNREIQSEANRLIDIVEKSACIREDVIETLLQSFKNKKELCKSEYRCDKLVHHGSASNEVEVEVAMSLHPFGSSCNMFGFGAHTDLDLVLLYGSEYHELAFDYDLLSRHHLKRKSGIEEDGADGAGAFDPVVILHLCKDAALATGQFQVLEVVETARIPILKLHHIVHDMDVDICINNALPLHNTKLLRQYASYDVTVRYLAFAVKQWAKCRGINNPHNSSFSSYTWVLLVIHFLQTQPRSQSNPNLNTKLTMTSIGNVTDPMVENENMNAVLPLLPSIPYPNKYMCSTMESSSYTNTGSSDPDSGQMVEESLAVAMNNMKIKEHECVVQGANTNANTNNTDVCSYTQSDTSASGTSGSGSGFDLPSTENIATLLCKFFAYYCTEGIGGFKPSARVGMIDRKHNVVNLRNNGSNNTNNNEKLHLKHCTTTPLYELMSQVFREQGITSELFHGNHRAFSSRISKADVDLGGDRGPELEEKNSVMGLDVTGVIDIDTDGTGSCLDTVTITTENPAQVSDTYANTEANTTLRSQSSSLEFQLGAVRVSSNSNLTWRFAIEDPLDYHDLGSVIYHRLGQANMMSELRRAYNILLNASNPTTTTTTTPDSTWSLLCQKLEHPPMFPYLCKHCDGTHSSRDCPLNLCYICHKSGHFGRNCPVKKEREDRKKQGMSGSSNRPNARLHTSDSNVSSNRPNAGLHTSDSNVSGNGRSGRGDAHSTSNDMSGRDRQNRQRHGQKEFRNKNTEGGGIVQFRPTGQQLNATDAVEMKKNKQLRPVLDHEKAKMNVNMNGSQQKSKTKNPVLKSQSKLQVKPQANPSENSPPPPPPSVNKSILPRPPGGPGGSVSVTITTNNHSSSSTNNKSKPKLKKNVNIRPNLDTLKPPNECI